MNVQDSDVIMFAFRVAILAESYHFSVTSWIRSPERNEILGGKPTSLHLTGEAADVVLDTHEVEEDFLADVSKAGLHYLIERSHIHLQARPALVPPASGA
jgi:uncharacterized protein YcbK (DUF882 family)